MSAPLFSVVWVGHNRLDALRTMLASVQAQTVDDFELLIDDCGSTDGTAEMVEAAAAIDPRIRPVNGAAADADETLLEALRSCRGEYVVICPPIGRMAPDALKSVADAFAVQTVVGAICTPGFRTGGPARIADRVDLVTLLFTPSKLFLPAMTIRRRALEAVGIHRYDWRMAAFAVDLTCRLSLGWGLGYLPHRLFADAGTVGTATAASVDAQIDDRLQIVDQMFARDGFFAIMCDAIATEAKVNLLNGLARELNDSGRQGDAGTIFPRLEGLAFQIRNQLRGDHRTLRSLHRLFSSRSQNMGLFERPMQKRLAALAGREDQSSIHAGYKAWSDRPWNKPIRKVVAQTVPADEVHADSPSWEALHADLYAELGQRYERRGQVDAALELWDRARPPQDATLDSVACQAALKTPTATERMLADRHQRWVDTYLGKPPQVFLPRQSASGERIRIGYHCSFMHMDTMRSMMREVLRHHDRSRFEVFGYAPTRPDEDILAVLDQWRHTPLPEYDDAKFVEQVRADKIDVFMELTGYSPGHRFAAMSRRCAPVQISFLNHTGTSRVPNVDYVLSDEICTPPGGEAEQYYTEKVCRMPGCFFCFDYTRSNEPEPGPPPHLRNGYTTYGCFGSGGKISRELIGIWSKLLHREPTARLFLQNPHLTPPGNRRYMAEVFEEFGIGADRLIIRGGVDRKRLLQSYREVDVTLDTWPYAGGNTIAESFWQGVPVVTLHGDRFASAYGASLVKAAGCADLAAPSADAYIDLAIRLAADSSRLVDLRRNLRRMSVEFGLGDSKLFARRLEEAYGAMLDQVGT